MSSPLIEQLITSLLSLNDTLEEQKVKRFRFSAKTSQALEGTILRYKVQGFIAQIKAGISGLEALVEDQPSHAEEGN